VRVILPVAAEMAPAAIAPSEIPMSARRGRILVIDDEPMVGAAVRRMLASKHDVVATTSAREAINRIVRGERFDVILCDLMMPEVTGMDLHAELLHVARDQAERMVFMTGGAFTSKAREFLDSVTNTRIEKPFEIADIAAIIQRVLGEDKG
jgi:CheY-like chemotaxis protein